MSGFEPGEGWREVEYGTRPTEPGWVMECLADGTERYWVRVPPVPQLPTEPGYYVDQDGCAWRLGDDGEWDDTFGNPIDLKHRDSQPKGLLVRYEPRGVTAKAVADMIERGATWDDVRREFGVTS